MAYYSEENPPPSARLDWVCPDCDRPLTEEQSVTDGGAAYDLRCETDGWTFAITDQRTAAYVPSKQD